MRYKLGEICEIVSGSTPKTSIPEYWDGDIKWITPAEISEESYIIEDSIRHITDLGVQKTGLTPFPKGTVILSSRAPIGKVAIAGCEMYCNQGFKNLICSEIIDNRYLYWFLKGNTEYLNSLGRGAAFKEISKKIVSEIEINVPSIEKQRDAVEILEKVSGIISIRKQELQSLGNLIKARFVELFEIEKGHYDECHLEDIADIVSGITKGRKTKCTQLREVPYMAVSNVKDGYIDWTTVKTILATEDEIEQYRLLPNDVLMTEGGDPDKVGRGSIISDPPEDCIHQNHIFRVRLDETRLLPRYFASFLQSPVAKMYFLRAAKQTTGIASINMKQLRGLPTILPPLNKQKEFVLFCQQVDKSKFSGRVCNSKYKLVMQLGIDKIHQLFYSLMQEFFG